MSSEAPLLAGSLIPNIILRVVKELLVSVMNGLVVLRGTHLEVLHPLVLSPPAIWVVNSRILGNTRLILILNKRINLFARL